MKYALETLQVVIRKVNDLNWVMEMSVVDHD